MNSLFCQSGDDKMVLQQSTNHDELMSILAREPAHSWPDIVALWASADRVYTAPAGPNGNLDPAYELVILVCDRIVDYLPYLNRDLTNPNANVCAYCLTCLEHVDMLHPTAAQREELLQRTEILNVITGCFGSKPTLAQFLERRVQSYL